MSRFAPLVLVLAVCHAADVIVEDAAGPCCSTCSNQAGTSKYYSIVSFPAPACGEACIPPSKYGIYKIFEPHLLPANGTAHPCAANGYPAYTKTVTHGVPGILSVTLDLYNKAAAEQLTPAEHDAARARLIAETNAVPGVLWKAGMPARFAGKPVGHSRHSNGVKPSSRATLLAAVARGEAEAAPRGATAAVPAAFDSETHWPQCAEVIGDIRDQSCCGCCWAFGAAEAASDRMCIATGGKLKLPLSAQDTCFCAQESGCAGGALFTAWSYIQSSGLVTGGQFNGTGPFGAGMCSDFSLPHCHHHGPQGADPYPDENSAGCPAVNVSPQCPSSCDASAKAPHNSYASDKYSFDGVIKMYSDEASIQQAIMTEGPVETAFTVYSDFENYVSGVYHHVSGSIAGGHAVRIVGWGVDGGTKYWKVANSWNPYWGEKGYFRIKRGTDECGIESQVTVGSGNWAKK